MDMRQKNGHVPMCLSGMGCAVFCLITIALTGTGCSDSQTDFFVAVGLGKLERGEYEEAARLLECAVQRDPQDATAYGNLGIAYLEMGNMGAAATAFGKAGDLCPTDSRPHEFLGYIHLRAKQWDKARQALEQAHQRCLISPRITTARAVVEFHAGQVQQAAAYLSKALELDPNYPPALYNLGLLHARHPREHAHAVAYFRRYLAAQEGDERSAGDPHVKTARFFLERGALPARASSVPRGDTDSPSAGLSSALGSAGVTSSAPLTAAATHSAFSQGPASGAPSAISPRLMQAREAIGREDYDQALVLLKEWVEKDPQNADALWELLQLYRRLPGRGQEADRLLGLFRARFPQDPRLARLSVRSPPSPSPAAQAGFRAEAVRAWKRGVECHRRNDLRGAIAAYDEAVRLDPNLYAAWYNLGLACRAQGNRPRAREAFRRALERKPDLVGASYMLAVVQWEERHSERAIQQLQNTLALDAHYAQAHFLLGSIYREKGQVPLARKSLERYLELAPSGAHAATARQWLATLPGAGDPPAKATP